MKRIWTRYSLTALLLAVAALFLFDLAAEAAVYQTIQLTDNDEDDQFPQVSGNNVVWEGFDGNDYEIFLFDGATTSQLTSNSSQDHQAHVSGDNVVWRGEFGGDVEILLYDGVSTSNVSNSVGNDHRPQVSGDNIVWYGEDTAGTGDDDIFFYDGATVTNISNHTFNDRYPTISGDRVAWIAGPGGESQVFYYDGTTTTQLTSGTAQNDGAWVSDTLVTWWGSEVTEDDDIFTYDGSTLTNLTNTPLIKDDVARSSGNHVAWNAGALGDDDEIFLYDGSTTTQITSNSYDDWNVRIDGDNMAWMGRVGGGSNDFEVIAYDGVTETQLTDNTHHDAYIEISGNNIVWQGHDGNDYEIFMAALVDQASNASLDTVSDLNVLNIDFGTVALNSSVAPIDFPVANLLPPGAISLATAYLDFSGATGTGDTGALTTDLAPFVNLVAGESLEFDALFDSSLPGTFDASYELSFTDALGTNQTLTLNLSGAVEAVDDPAIPDLIYNAATGEVILDPDASPGIIGYALKNLTDSFLPGAHTPILGGVTTSLTSELAEAALSSGSGSIGFVMPVGMNLAQLAALLDVNQVSTGLGSPLVAFDLIVIPAPIPEPSTWVLACFGLLALGFAGRRRRRA